MSSGISRILFLQQNSIFEGYGGVEYYQDDFLSMLAEWLPTTPPLAVIPKRNARFTLTKRPYEIHVVEFSRNKWVQKLQNRFSRRYLTEAIEAAKDAQPSLIVCGHVNLAPIAYLVSKAVKVPFVVIAYGIEVWGDLWPQDSYALNHAKGIISISHWTKRTLIERGVPADRIQVVQPTLPPEFEKTPPPRAERPREAPLTLLTVGRLDAREQYKGHDHVLEAIHRIRLTEPKAQFRYIIQGDGTDLPRIKALTKEMGLDDCVVFRPPLQDRALSEASYLEADVYVMPSRFGSWDGKWRGEGFGIVYLEAAAFGLPLVAYDCGGATDIIRTGENGMLVDPDNIGELARALLHLSKNRRLVGDLGRKAYEMVMRDFTRAAIRKQLASALDYFHSEITQTHHENPPKSQSR